MTSKSKLGQSSSRLFPVGRGSDPCKTFTEAKKEFDDKYQNATHLPQSIVPVDGKIIENVPLKDVTGGGNEEYYKWQFVYGLVYSGLVFKDYIGVEISFPKGNKNAAPLKVDACIFDDKSWLQYYQKWKDSGDQYSLQWLRNHCIAAVEFKRGKDNIDKTFSNQLRPAMKESESPYVLGIIYDMGRLYLFQRKNGQILRYDESKNKVNGDSVDLSLSDTDSYLSIPSFDEIVANINKPATLDRSKRSIWDLDTITGRSSVQVKDALNRILRTLDNHSLEGQNAYEIFIQTLALKIFDEKSNQKDKRIPLRFYVTENERKFAKLTETPVRDFIERMRLLYDEAEGEYKVILKDKRIDWQNEAHIRAVQSIAENFQDFSLIRSGHTDLYQLVFYNFAHHFQIIEKAQFLTPLPIIEFIVKIVNPRGNESVCDPCVGIGDFLSLSYVFSDPKLYDDNLWGIDISDNMIALAQLNMLLNGDGNCHLVKADGLGSIIWKVSKEGKLVSLDPRSHRYNEKTNIADWDKWADKTKLLKFDVVLTNPPFGKGRTFEVKTQEDREIMEMYETYWADGKPKSVDKGIIFLENAYHILAENGRMGIVLSNAIASEDSHREVMHWLMTRMRIVAIFDFPPDVFAETGVNTTVIIAYKPKQAELTKLRDQNYSVFPKNITKIGYEKKTKKRNIIFEKQYKVDPTTFDYVINENGERVLDEEFTQTIKEFKEWAKAQEESLQKAFIL